MNTKKVIKENDQIKLFVDPDLLARGFNIEDLLREVQLEVKALGVSMGAIMMQKLIGAEIGELIGDRYGREEEKCYVWGKQNGYVMVGGQKVRIEHQRIRRGRGKGEEVVPESYRRFQQEDDRTRRVFSNMLARVSCRKYGKAIETVQAGYGISKSAVNREMIRATKEQLAQLYERRLEEIDMVVLVIDGIDIAGTVFITALAIDRKGFKHLLGFAEGPTENADVCRELLENLKERGLRTDQSILALLDGSKALYKGIKGLWGKRVLIHRCHEHKIRNVLSHLPKKYHVEVKQKLQAAYKMNEYTKALEAIQSVLRYLERLNDAAAGSLREGMEETLTVHKLGLPEILRNSLLTTNAIESAYSRYRDVMGNVKRWRDGDHKRRWIATALWEAQRSFRRIKGYRSIPVLIAAIEREVAKSEMNTQAA
jgi:transposase-like protein